MSRAIRSPAFWHYASLVLGAAYILTLQQGQWFFFDEFAFIEPDGVGPWDAHVGHWSTAPWLIYQVLLHTLGMASYWPFAILITALHLMAAHLAWRIAMRSGATGWLATCAVAVFLVFGRGNENILWAFQIGFVGALVLGLLAFLLAMRQEQSWWRLAGIIAISLVSLTWSGTSIPLVVATAAVLLVRHGWGRAVLHAGITGGVYLVWYLAFALGTGPDTGGFTAEKLFLLMPLFLGVMLFVGFGEILPSFSVPSPNPDSVIFPDQIPVPILGFAALVVAAIWLIRALWRRVDLAVRAPAFILVGAAALFALMTAFSRAAMAWTSGASSRYIYLIVLLMLPALILALDAATKRLAARWASGGKVVVPVASLLLLALAGYQGSILFREAQAQAEREQQTRRILDAEIELYKLGETGLDLNAVVEQWAPDLQFGELVELYERGIYVQTGFGPEDLDLARQIITAP